MILYFRFYKYTKFVLAKAKRFVERSLQLLVGLVKKNVNPSDTEEEKKMLPNILLPFVPMQICSFCKIQFN